MIRTTILIDNISNREGLVSEWGLAMLIEYNGMSILLDTGASGQFAENAAVLGVDEIAEGVYLVPHTTPGLEVLGEKVGQYIKVGDEYISDDYSHEQSLVFKTDDGLVIMYPSARS